MNWRVVLVGAAVVAVAVVVGIVVAADDDPEGTVPTSVTLSGAAGAGLDQGGAELVGLLAAGRESTYHAVYALSGPMLEAESTIEVWRDGDRVRQDTFLRAQDGLEVLTAGIQVDGRIITCNHPPGGDWTCAEAEASTGGTDVFGSVEDQLEGVAVTARDGEVAGRPARCFDFDTDRGPGSTCVTADGVPLLLERGASRIELTRLDEDVPDDVFIPPAQPGG